MKTYTADELKTILENHEIYLKTGAITKADLSGADLRWANLSRANLRWANLSGADLSGANLSGADLRWANLSGADLSGANLSGANLSGADLRWANLSGADLSGANLSGADLSGADLRWANLRWANLSGANLSGADLSGADLRWANLRWANLSKVDLSMFKIISNGTIEVYKQLQNNCIAVLEISKKTKRVNAYGSRKCRAESAKVIEIRDNKGRKVKEAMGLYNNVPTKYVVGKTIKPDSFDPDPRIECSNGVHFFITRQEAENYNG